MADILVVDDEIGIRELLNEILGDEGHTVLLAENAAQARRMRNDQELDLVLLDIWMPEVDGVSLLKEWAAAGKLSMPVIMMSGHATIDTAVEATRIGALDFLEKPISLQKLLKTVENGLARRTISRGVPRPQTPSAHPQGQGRSDVQVPDDENGHLQGLAQGQPQGQSHGMPEGVHPNPSQSAQASAGLPPLNGDDPGLEPGVGLVDRTGMMTAVVATARGPGQARALDLDLPLREARDAFERTYFEHHLAREQGSMTRVAEKTGLERTHLYRKLKQLGIDLSKGAFRKSGVGQS
jgi:DNA-binding NtrC family response regulator